VLAKEEIHAPLKAIFPFSLWDVAAKGDFDPAGANDRKASCAWNLLVIEKPQKRLVPIAGSAMTSET
jgi:hypothetical protein